jgi:mannose-6-phosphate isomerase-like protein (cupin superfamily)
MEQPSDLGRRLSEGEGEVRRWGGTIVTIKQTAPETEGRYTLLEILDSPGTLVPLHIHHREDETFYLLEGSMRIRVGSDVFDAGVRSLVEVPKGVPHGWAVTSSEPLRCLLLFSPGGFEDYVRETSEPIGDQVVGSPEVVEAFQVHASGHGVEVVGTADDLF